MSPPPLQCDRHAQNLFIDEGGQIKLIDNEMALQSWWPDCGVDSILVPTTQKYNIVRMGMAVSARSNYQARRVSAGHPFSAHLQMQEWCQESFCPYPISLSAFI